MSNVTEVFDGAPACTGFGLREHRGGFEKKLQAAAGLVTRILRAGDMPEPTVEVLDAFSLLKGMYNRIHRQDQADWFTTKVRLGYPTDQRSASIGNALAACRKAAKEAYEPGWTRAREWTRLLKVRRSLAVLRGRRALARLPGSGFAYLMSDIQDRDLLAVGVTDRPILEEAAHVNATASHPALGVRAVWWVSDVPRARRVLDGLTASLPREDDGRFEADFRWFSPAVDRALAETGLSMDPLGHLVRVPSGKVVKASGRADN